MILVPLPFCAADGSPSDLPPSSLPCREFEASPILPLRSVALFLNLGPRLPSCRTLRLAPPRHRLGLYVAVLASFLARGPFFPRPGMACPTVISVTDSLEPPTTQCPLSPQGLMAISLPLPFVASEDPFRSTLHRTPPCGPLFRFTSHQFQGSVLRTFFPLLLSEGSF